MLRSFLRVATKLDCRQAGRAAALHRVTCFHFCVLQETKQGKEKWSGVKGGLWVAREGPGTIERSGTLLFD